MPKLEPWQKVDLIRKVFETGTRTELDRLTREIWRRFASDGSEKLNEEASRIEGADPRAAGHAAPERSALATRRIQPVRGYAMYRDFP